MSKLTKEDRAALLDYTLGIAGSLRLHDWAFILREGAERGSWAESISTYGKREFTIRFCKNFRKAPRAQVRETIVHELLHAHLQPTWQYLNVALPAILNRKATAAFRHACHQREEEAVNDIARAIAPFFPLIKWPK